MPWQNLLLIVFGVWILVVSVLIYRLLALFNKLTKGVEAKDLKSVLEKVFNQEAKNQKDIQELGKRLSVVETGSRLHIQKVGLVRFNPFKELGGDHSFSLAILDGESSGVLITSLHTRDRTRVYLKSIKKGKSDVELSEEEKKALTKVE